VNDLRQHIEHLLKLVRVWAPKADTIPVVIAAQAALSANAEPSGGEGGVWYPSDDDVLFRARIIAGRHTALIKTAHIIRATADLVRERDSHVRAVGDAGYPSPSDIGALKYCGTVCGIEQISDIIRAAIDLERERVAKLAGGAGSGKTVAWRDAISECAMQLDAASHLGGERHLSVTAGDVSERLLKLVERSYSHPPTAQGFGPVVFWQYQDPSWGPDQWIGCSEEYAQKHAKLDDRIVRALTVRQPVPDYIIRACERYLEIHERYISDETMAKVREWTRSVSA